MRLSKFLSCQRSILVFSSENLIFEHLLIWPFWSPNFFGTINICFCEWTRYSSNVDEKVILTLNTCMKIGPIVRVLWIWTYLKKSRLFLAQVIERNELSVSSLVSELEVPVREGASANILPGQSAPSAFRIQIFQGYEREFKNSEITY